jgi:selenocysteine lyase/cysteine desulfurase
MPTSRRSFIQKAGMAAGALTLTGILSPKFAEAMMEADRKIAHLSPSEAANDEDFWTWVRESYTVSQNIINLNNGGVSPQPRVVQETHERYLRMSNEGPSYYMWRILDQGREPLRSRLAEQSGCSAEEISICRNSTEALNNVIFGLNLKAGDEVVLSKQDYPNMMNAWKQRELREGIKLNWVDLQLPTEDDGAIVKAFTNAFTDKTKVVHITHLINWTGQILPVATIARAAHKKGIEVLVDGAHTYAHIDFKIPDLECDYFGTSLHKWLGAPFGSGLLYIKKDKIKNIWPLLSNDHPQGEDIRKFESLGTRSFASEMSIAMALDFHQAIGNKRKEERLRYLKNYWVEKALKIPGFKILTPLKPHLSCAIALFSIDGISVADVDNQLFGKHKIHAVAIDKDNLPKGVRITPNVYTSTKDLDRLVLAIAEIAKTGNTK